MLNLKMLELFIEFAGKFIDSPIKWWLIILVENPPENNLTRKIVIA